MTQTKPSIASLQPVVLADNRRVTMELVVKNLPTVFANVAFSMPDTPDKPPKPAADAPSPYPNIELSILNSRRQQVASLFIVEHREKVTTLTMHLRAPEVYEQYTARAEMTYLDEIIDVVEIPFTLHQAG
jgi:hypothetical protein